MRLLALDVGRRNTGVAFFDDQTGVTLPLATIHATNKASLIDQLTLLIQERACDRIICGMPLLPSGDIGDQARFTHSVIDALKKIHADIVLLDERYTTGKYVLVDGQKSDRNAAAACLLLETYLQRQNS